MTFKECKMWNIGDEVWFWETWSQMPVPAHIIELNESHAHIKWLSGGSNIQPLENLYYSREALIEAVNKKKDEMVATYKTSIKSVEDLVQFMFAHTVSSAEEYTEWEARKAAVERAKELLNINLLKE